MTTRTRYFIRAAGPELGRRSIQLVAGLMLFGVGIVMMLQSNLGVPPWDVLHQGLSKQFGLTVGIWSIIVSVIVLLGWLPLKEPYGLGTLANAVIIGVMIDLFTLFIPEPEAMVARVGLVVGGILLIGVATGMYIGASLGPGPRDGLMTGIAKYGPSIRLTRTTIEIVVLASGWALGGTFGVGTIAFALFIGPIAQFFLHRWAPQTAVSTAPKGR